MSMSGMAAGASRNLSIRVWRSRLAFVMNARAWIFGTGLAALCAVHAVAQTELATGPFTAAQSAAGRKAYLTHCASCHQANLSGKGDAYPLAGRQFMAGWANQTSQALYNKIHSSMPTGALGSLEDETYADLTAFILHANGAKPGPTAFLRAPPLPIGLIANGI